MKNQIFKTGDRVFHHLFGWGTIDECKLLLATLRFDEGGFMVKDVDSLSYSEYSLEGFSQEPPEDLPNFGDIVWARDGKIFNWEVYHFINYNPNAKFPYTVSPDCDEDNLQAFKHITKFNPYSNEQ